MAIGDSNDIFARLKAALPQRWFGSTSDSMPVVDSLLTGITTALSFIYSLYLYAKLQTRILTATDGWLDMVAADFFGTSVLRKAGQSDASFRANIIANMFRIRATRPAMVKVIADVTGFAPIIFEPNRPFDTGCMNTPASVGFCGVARMGSVGVPCTAMITAYRPKATGAQAGGAYTDAPVISAMNTPLAQSYTNSLALSASSVTDADIYAAIDLCKPIGTVMWVAITNHA